MARTFLYVKENDFLIYHNPEILTADALIIDVYDVVIFIIFCMNDIHIAKSFLLSVSVVEAS